MGLMDDKDELKLELVDINNDFLNILKKVRGKNVVLDLEDRVWELEDLNKDLEKNMPRKRKNTFECFGDNLIEAYLNLSRTRARRAERRVVALERQKEKSLLPKGVLIYMNRVSDVLYLMSVIKK
jgi:cob(I)alamin adenosyltransferase